MKVKSLYVQKTNVVTCTDDMTVGEALEVLTKSGYRCVPVVNGTNFVGLVYKIDVKEYIYEQNGSLTDSIKEIVSDEDAFVTPYTSFVKALLTIKRLPFLAVVEKKQLLGILTHSKVMEVLEDALGVKTGGIHLTIAGTDRRGSLYSLLDELKAFNIEGVLSLDNGTKLFRRTSITLPLSTSEEEISTIIRKVEHKGFRVIDRETINHT
ncbi:CBS domain-containing protein [Metabacillus iocasae]|uniref:CBS domain-containing protein n=1 Tax=Priestia iocasae TaxID=2291674 RepID=A0ABS2QXI6_9BACI|nr:CBS domain-containing protein [Metabacillus iocasae]MBM7703717.1 CBS domain-containing protein [Metabacillus iocasae]